MLVQDVALLLVHFTAPPCIFGSDQAPVMSLGCSDQLDTVTESLAAGVQRSLLTLLQTKDCLSHIKGDWEVGN